MEGDHRNGRYPYVPYLLCSLHSFQLNYLIPFIAVMYSLTKQLARILSLPLTLHRSLAPRLEKSKKTDPETHKHDDVPPEVAFIATLIIVLKMVYGLDDKSNTNRTPNGEDDPLLALPTKEQYLDSLRKVEKEDRSSKEALFSSRMPM